MTCSRLARRVTDQFGNVELADDTAFVVVGGRVVVVPEIPPLGSHQLKKTVVTGLFVAEWFGSMGRTWGELPLADQYTGGGVAWSIGEIPTLILAITVAIQWSRSDERLQRRADRQADRTNDAELEQYNAQLQALADRDARARR